MCGVAKTVSGWIPGGVFSMGSAILQGSSSLFRKRRKRSYIRDGEVCQDFSVNGNVGLFKAVDQAAVRESVKPGGGIDSYDPQRAEIPLFLATVPVCIGKRTINGVVRGAIKLASSSAVASRGFEDLFASAPGCDAVRRSGHIDGLLVAPGGVWIGLRLRSAMASTQNPHGGGKNTCVFATQRRVSWAAGA